MSLLQIEHLTHSYGDKVLYQNAAFELYQGEHMGVVGQNGAGKSTLIGILTGEIAPDTGVIRWQPRLKMGHLDQYAAIDGSQSIQDYLKTAFSDLIKLEEDMNACYERYAQTGSEHELSLAADAQARLEAGDFYTLDTKIDKVANGLGLSALGMQRLLGSLSGGQRAKVILAKLLLEQPDVLLLDEPTNFLDKEHVEWLSGFLSAFPNAFLVVSHDHAFLERVCTCIGDVENYEIRKYHGKYSDFLKQKEHLREDYIRRFSAQQEHIKKTEAFIRKNIAGVNTKMAQGRRKQLERLERLAPPSFTVIKPDFRFQELPMKMQEALTVHNLQVGYDFPLLLRLNLTVKGGQKVVVTGFNGIGKSTLLKTLVGAIPRLGGTFSFAPTVQIGYYAQDLIWEDPSQTPLAFIADCYPRLTTKEVRKHLSLCGVGSDHMQQAIGTLSGGEQAKVKLCRLVLSPCNFLILDEPTNHLDAQAKQALGETLGRFSGNILLVSHEPTFYQSWAGRVIDMERL